MKIESYFDKKLNKKMWRIDLTVSDQRIRERNFVDQAEAVKYIVRLLEKKRLKKHSFGTPKEITLQSLYEARIADPECYQINVVRRIFKQFVALSPLAQEILRRHETPLMNDVADWKFYEMITEVSEAARLPYGDKAKDGWVPHDLRHTAATVIESKGIRYSVVSALLNHKRRDQTATYTHASLEDLRGAVTVLENWCREIDGFLTEPYVAKFG